VRGGGAKPGAGAFLQAHPIGGLAKPLGGRLAVGVAGELTGRLGDQAAERREFGGRRENGCGGRDAEQIAAEDGALQQGAAPARSAGLGDDGGPVDGAGLHEPRDVDQPEEPEPAVTRAVLKEIERIEVGRERALRVPGGVHRDGAGPKAVDLGETFEAPEQLDAQGEAIADVFELGLEAQIFLKLAGREGEVGARAAQTGGLQNGIGGGDVMTADHEIDVTGVASAGAAVKLLGEYEALDRQRLDAAGGEGVGETELLGGLGQRALGGLRGQLPEMLNDGRRARGGHGGGGMAMKERGDAVALDALDEGGPGKTIGCWRGRSGAEPGAHKSEQEVQVRWKIRRRRRGGGRIG